MSERFSAPPEEDQALPGMEDYGQFERVEDAAYIAGPPLTDEQFTAIFYEGGEAAERAKAEIAEAIEKTRGMHNG